MRICVYCASSQKSDPVYREAAFTFGQLLADGGHTLVYGGGSVGSMGAVADGVLTNGGDVIGIMPHFMDKLEWGHPDLTQLELVDNMGIRKNKLLTDSDAVVALPGGCGTLDELFEAITLKRLGVYLNPIILLDTKGFYTPLDAFMAHVIDEQFMGTTDAAIWQRVAEPEDILPAIDATPAWHDSVVDYDAASHAK